MTNDFLRELCSLYLGRGSIAQNGLATRSIPKGIAYRCYWQLAFFKNSISCCYSLFLIYFQFYQSVLMLCLCLQLGKNVCADGF